MIEGGVEAALKAHYAGVRKRLRMDPPQPRVWRPEPIELPKFLPVRATEQVEPLKPDGVPDLYPANWKVPLWRRIMVEVCNKHRITISEMVGQQRARNITAARHELYYRLKTETTMNLPQIGHRIGGRDHTTILSGLRAHLARAAKGKA